MEAAMTLPLADRSHGWDGAAAEKRVAAWATTGDTINFTKFGQAFAIKGDGKTQGSYKLPYADVIGGTLTAVWKGVTSAAGVLNGAMGGVHATPEQKATARSVIASYYAAAKKKFGDDTITVPWASSSSSGGHETRSAAITERDGDGHGFWAKLVTYGPADSYNTRWKPGVFDESVASHMPVLAWGHDWSEPIGRMDNYQDREDGPYGHFRLDDGDYVPRAKQALHQLNSGTLTDVSVGILRTGDEPNDDGTTTITRADLDEVSLVLRGAVPGATVMAGSVRSERRGVQFDDVIELVRRVRAGTVTQDEALATIDLLGGTTSDVSTGTIDEPPAGVQEEAIVPADVAEALAEADIVESTRARW